MFYGLCGLGLLNWLHKGSKLIQGFRAKDATYGIDHAWNMPYNPEPDKLCKARFGFLYYVSIQRTPHRVESIKPLCQQSPPKPKLQAQSPRHKSPKCSIPQAELKARTVFPKQPYQHHDRNPNYKILSPKFPVAFRVSCPLRLEGLMFYRLL